MKVKVKTVQDNKWMEDESINSKNIFELNRYIQDAYKALGETRELWDVFEQAAKATEGFTDEIMMRQMFLVFCYNCLKQKKKGLPCILFDVHNTANNGDYYFHVAYFFNTGEFYHKK